jgi:hypothetical protein
MEISQEGKENILKNLLELNPNGITLVDARNVTGLSYYKLKKKIEEWGYKIVSKKFIRYRNISVIVKGD